MFVIRIELHNTTNYEPLHAAMARRGMARTIPCSDGVTYDLPSGTYYTALGTLATVTAAAEAAAAEAGHRDPLIVVAEATGIRISNLSPTPAWRKGA